MIYKEEKKNLFEVDERYSLAHCISLDCEMGKGIAVEFDKRFKGMKSFLKIRIDNHDTSYPITIPCFIDKKLRVFNLITKKNYWNKPTYQTITECIGQMAEQCERHNIKYLAIPKIGCGLDRLQWGKVKEIIHEKFKDLDIEVLVCEL